MRKGQATARVHRAMRPAGVLALGFLFMILLGTLILWLPASAAGGESIGLVAALFTATSATCVTGLSVLDIGTALSGLGQAVVLALLQVGGLGFMLFATLAMVALGRRITLHDRMVISESMNSDSLSGGVRMSIRFAALALCIEAAGALLLAVRFVPAMGWRRGLYYALFHSASAFCNAGFALFPDNANLTAYRADAYVLLVISALIVLGGLGFAVLSECLRKRRFSRLSLHAKIVLASSALLLAGGFVFFAAAEWNNPRTLALGGAPAGERLLGALFQSVTTRTAGFNSIDQAGMTEAARLMSIVLMFIGASPASTGGGVKTTTMSVLLLIVLNVLRGQEDINAFGRRLPVALVRTAVTILVLFLSLVIAGTMVITVLEGGRQPFLDILFETTSAMATVGLSTAGTPELTQGSQLVLTALMYAGRVGPMTLMLALTDRRLKRKNILHFPEERIMIG